MASLFLAPTPTAHWHQLIIEAQRTVQINLGEELESYLVFLLMRFIEKPDIANFVVALEFLSAAQEDGHLNAQHLQKIGDICLLLAGLFPQRAVKRCIRVSYFVNIGQSAYDLRSQHDYQADSLFHHLASKFVALMDVLQAVRNIDNPQSTALLSPLDAYELWEDTGSIAAKQAIERSAGHTIVLSKILQSQRN